MKRMVDTKAVELIEKMSALNIDANEAAESIDVVKGNSAGDDFYANEGDITLIPVPGASGITFSFAHWRISNGKLNIIIAGKIKNLVTNPNGLIVGSKAETAITIPSFAWDALYPNIPISFDIYLGVIDAKVISPVWLNQGYYAEGWTEASPIAFTVMKLTNNRMGIAIGAQSAISMSDDKEYTFRAEFNFVL